MNTKILVTLGPSSLNKEVLKRIDRCGIFVFRINLSHTPIAKLEEIIKWIQLHTDTPICLDSEGAQIRNQNMASKEVDFIKGESVKIHANEVIGDKHNISFTPSNIVSQLQVGDLLNIDFNNVCLQVQSVMSDDCDAIVISGGKVGSNKAVDLNREIQLASMTAKDEQAIEIGKRMGINHFALSFAGSKADVELLRSKIGNDAYLISKVESISGLKNLLEITQSSDAILIDRGDLSRQVIIEKIPFFQRRITSLVRSKGKDVFVATNLLESMVTTQAPTRAEVNDVISTLMIGASGLVLAAETAAGLFPAECAEMTRKLINQFELWTPNTSMSELLD